VRGSIVKKSAHRIRAEVAQAERFLVFVGFHQAFHLGFKGGNSQQRHAFLAAQIHEVLEGMRPLR